jgi:hypothetical protein
MATRKTGAQDVFIRPSIGLFAHNAAPVSKYCLGPDRKAETTKNRAENQCLDTDLLYLYMSPGVHLQLMFSKSSFDSIRNSSISTSSTMQVT